MMKKYGQMSADPEKPRFFWELCNTHKGILLLLLLAAALIFPNLGRDALWNDEGDTAYWGLSIMHSGLPLAWDGRNFDAQDPGGFTDNLVYVALPWVTPYITAASMLLFGETAWAARFPCAMAGLGTVLMLYLLVLRATGEKKTALYSAAMLLLCVLFFLYARSCRYYAFIMLFTCAALWAFLKLDVPRRVPLFALSTILLFYSLYPPAICVLAALAFLTVVYKPFHKYRRGFWLSLLIIVPATLPWLLYIYYTLSDITPLPLSLEELSSRVGQVMIEVGVAAPLLGWLGLLVLAKKPLLKKSRDLLVLCGTTMVALASADICMHDTVKMAMFGIRHYSGIIPLAAAMSSLLVLCIGRTRWQTNVILLLVLGATHLGGNLLPWLMFKSEDLAGTNLQKTYRLHVPKVWWQMIFRCEIPGYLLELCRDNPGAVNEICKVLREHANPNDTLFVNYEWESIYFYTRMPQAGKLAPEDPVYKTARQHEIPEYVFDASAANWVVWRPVWGWHRYGDNHMQRALAVWAKQGRTVTEVARIKETVWENRPNLYYHRFPVFGYIYQGFSSGSFSDAVILRVK
jgi:hypothetical protein